MSSDSAGADEEVLVVEEQGMPVIRCIQRLDATTSPALEQVLLDLLHAGSSKMVLDFSHVVYLSSAGMRVLLSLTKKCCAAGGGLYICSLGEEVAYIIEMAGLQEVMQLFGSQEEAIAKAAEL